MTFVFAHPVAVAFAVSIAAIVVGVVAVEAEGFADRLSARRRPRRRGGMIL